MEISLRYEGYLSIFSWNTKLSRRFIFRYHFKTKGMLLTAKSVFVFEIDAWSLLQKKLNFSSLKLKPVEQWKVAYVTRVKCQCLAGILSYLEDSCFRIILI